MSLLELRDLAVTYRTADGRVPAVRGVSLRLDEGQTLGIAGESGCGKSTLAAAVLRLLPRTAKVTGEVLFQDEDVLTMRWGQLRAVRWAGASIVFQGAMHSLNPVQKIGKQIAEPILLHEPKVTPAAAAKRVASLLEQVGLPAWRANGYPHELSGGQKQRIMIAMALACSPNLIVADEPTTALDVMIQAQVLRLITGLVAERGIGMIMISHDLSVLSVTCAAAGGDVRGPGRRGGPRARGVHRRAAPVRPGAGPGLPGDRRRAVPAPAARARRRPAGPGRPAVRLLVPPALPGRRAGVHVGGDRPVAGRAGPGGRLHPGPPGSRRRQRQRGGRMTAPVKPAGPGPGTAGPGTAMLSADGVAVRFAGRGRRPAARAVDGVNLDIAAGRDRRAGRRVRLRQDHAGPDPARPGAADRGPGPVRGQAAVLPDRRAEGATAGPCS